MSDEVAAWDVWFKTGAEFERVTSVKPEDVPKIEEYFASMRCGTSLILF